MSAATRTHQQVKPHWRTRVGMDTLAHACGHTPFLRCSFSWLSSPCAASWWMDRAGGQREAESSPVPSLSKVAPLTPATPPLLSSREPGAHSQSKVAGRAETSLPRCRLVRVVECFRELPAGREKGLQFPLSMSWVLRPDPGGWAEKAMAMHSSTLAWKIPWTEKPGRLQSIGSQRVGHD